MKKLVSTFHYIQYNGVGLWRMETPKKYLRRLGYKVYAPRFPKKMGAKMWTPREEIEAYSKSDIIVFQRRDEPNWIAKMLGAREEFRVPVVLETDDMVGGVPVYNPAFRHYAPGSDNQYWAEELVRLADAVIVSTPNLGEMYRKLNPNVYVCENFIDREFWTGFPEPPRDDSKVIIGWSGAGGHYGNLQIIKDVIPRILEKYPQVEFHYVGGLPPFWKKEKTPEGSRWVDARVAGDEGLAKGGGVF